MPSANNAVQKSCVLLEQIRQRRTAPNLGKEISILSVADFWEFLLPKTRQLSIRNPCQSKLLPLSNAAWKTRITFRFYVNPAPNVVAPAWKWGRPPRADSSSHGTLVRKGSSKYIVSPNMSQYHRPQILSE